MSNQPYGWGLIVSPTPYKKIEVVYAELSPSAVGKKWWRRLLPSVGNWWFEVHSTDGYHHYKYDGGAYTLRGAIFKAMQAVDEVSEQEFGS